MTWPAAWPKPGWWWSAAWPTGWTARPTGRRWEAGCPTVAFLGTAIDKTFPAANEPLRRRIEAGGGAVVSEYPPHYQGKATGTFLARNRLIAGLAEAVCVTEARSRSGTLNTVRHAETYGRPVLAVPGSIYSPTSEGTHALLRAGRAQLLCSAADILAAIGMEGGRGAPAGGPGGGTRTFPRRRRGAGGAGAQPPHAGPGGRRHRPADAPGADRTV